MEAILNPVSVGSENTSSLFTDKRKSIELISQRKKREIGVTVPVAYSIANK